MDLRALNSLIRLASKGVGGKGMQDDVPAIINGVQPAALSEGEYVITADVVSLIGDGNNEAGAKILDEWVKQLRQLKTGTDKQPKETEKVLAQYGRSALKTQGGQNKNKVPPRNVGRFT